MTDNVIFSPQWVRNAEQSLTDDAPQTLSPVATGGGGPHDPGMEPRVAALEADMKDVKAVLGDIRLVLTRLDERTTHLATKEDVANVRTDLASKATRGTVWTMGFTVAALFVAALAAGAVYMPYLATLLRRAGP